MRSRAVVDDASPSFKQHAERYPYGGDPVEIHDTAQDNLQTDQSSQLSSARNEQHYGRLNAGR